jgi:putative phosphoesterase
MRIGLISDTHIPLDAEIIPSRVREIFQDVDLILHAGDIYISSVLDALEAMAPVLAAAGDDDYGDVRRDGRVKERHILHVEGVTIWLTHLMSRSWLKKEKKPGIIVLGHSHTASIERRGGILMVNPGSPTCPHDEKGIGTVAVLDILSGETDARIVPVTGAGK